MLNYLRCNPPKPLIWYHNIEHAPITKLLREAGLGKIDPTYVAFTDSSFADCDNQKSTGCYIILYQGGAIAYESIVPPVIAMSSCQSETNMCTCTVMGSRPITMTIQELEHGNATRPFTLPILTDSSSAKAVTDSDAPTKRTRHMERRFLYCRLARQLGICKYIHISNQFMVADIGTKVLNTEELNYPCSIVEAQTKPVPKKTKG